MVIYSSMKKYKVALFIGRFQPFHNGHLFSLNKCLEIADRVIVGVGSSQESGTESNPWNFETRKLMIESVLRGPTLRGSSSQVVGIPDNASDEIWLQDLVKSVGEFDVVVSNNDWVLSIMKSAGYEVVESGLFNREELEGVKIREMMRKGDEGWKLRVPGSVCQLISDSVNQVIGVSASREDK